MFNKAIKNLSGLYRLQRLRDTHCELFEIAKVLLNDLIKLCTVYVQVIINEDVPQTRHRRYFLCQFVGNGFRFPRQEDNFPVSVYSPGVLCRQKMVADIDDALDGKLQVASCARRV